MGDIEYRVVAPVLKKITSPLQLRNLEARSPQLAGDDAELWKKFIARDFGTDSVDKWVPKNPKNWSRIYDVGPPSPPPPPRRPMHGWMDRLG